MIIGEKHLNHTDGVTQWHSLPLIVFPPFLYHSCILPFFLSHTFFILFWVFTSLALPSSLGVTMRGLASTVILGTWEIKSIPMTDDHRSEQERAAVCNDTDMVCAFFLLSPRLWGEPCQVAGCISGDVMKYIIKVLVNKPNALSNSTCITDMDTTTSLGGINGSLISSETGHSWGITWVKQRVF